MTTLSNPNVTANILGAAVPVANSAQRILMLGLMTSEGTATDGELNLAVDKTAIRGLAGTGSMTAEAFLMAREINEVTPIDVILLDDPTGTAAVGNILWDGTATEAGTLTVGCGSYFNGKAPVTITSGMTSDNVATAVTAAFASLTDCVATVTTDDSTTDQNNFTYNHDSLEGNDTALYVEGSVSGIKFTITGFTGGAGAPTMTSVLDAIGDTRYQTVIAPASFGTSYLTTYLDSVFNVENDVRDGVAIVSVTDSYADHITALASLNSKSLAYRAESAESLSWYKGSSMFITDFAGSAMIGAIRALRLSTGENIASYVNAVAGPRDATGGPAIASLPYYNTPMPWDVMFSGFGFSSTQVKALKTAGGFVVGNNSAGTGVVLGNVTTTYKTDAQGSADTTFKYLNYVDTYSNVREYIFNNIKSDTNQSRLTDGALAGGRIMNNEDSIRAKLERYCQTLSGDDYVLVEAGAVAADFISQNIVIAITKSTGDVNVSMKVPIVTQLRTIVVNIAFTFNVNE